jgi:hypothetical protein
VVPLQQRLGESFDHDRGEMRRPMMRKRLTQGAVLGFAVLVGAAVVLFATIGANAGLSKSGNANAQSSTGRAYFVHGKLTYPAEIAAKIDSLNNALDSCYRANGATKTSIPQGGWTYDDPNGTATAACSAQQNAVNAFANSATLTALGQAAAPLVSVFSSCLRASGVIPATDEFRVDTHSAAYQAAADSCSAKANAAEGVSAP